MIKCLLEVDSVYMLMPVRVHVLLPYPNLQGKRVRNLWALHCALKGGSFFINELGLSEIVDRCAIAVIAPDLGNSYFVDSAYANAGSFLEKELYPLLIERFSLSAAREDNFALGISMGAYGAVHWLLSEPQRFFKAFLISGVYDFSLDSTLKDKLPRDICSLYRTISTMQKLLYNDGAYTAADFDLFKLLDKAYDCNTRIAMYCGSDDVYSTMHTMSFFRRLQAKGFAVSMKSSSGGHDPAYWRRTVGDIFRDDGFYSKELEGSSCSHTS